MEKINIAKILDTVFKAKKEESVLVLYDTPKTKGELEGDWQERIGLARSWHSDISAIGFKAELASYDATYANNSDLPENCLLEGKKVLLKDLICRSKIVIALTEFSATAPLKAFAKKYSIRAASVPGFNSKMIPAMNLDYSDVAKKVDLIYGIMEKSEYLNITFGVGKTDHRLQIDLRNRTPKKDDGDCSLSGAVINLPSGEAFIVPYEGEDGESRTKGFLPIQEKGKIRLYKIENNKVIKCMKQDMDPLYLRVKSDPAVGNVAEAAFGVLGYYGIKGCGQVLLDEKLGMHIALGRSEHLGGKTSPDRFRKKSNVWHQDYVYTKDMQPGIIVKEAALVSKKERFTIIKDGNYVIF